MTLHILNDIAYDAESTQIENYAIIASLKSETMGKVIKRITRFASLDIKCTRLSFENAC